MIGLVWRTMRSVFVGGLYVYERLTEDDSAGNYDEEVLYGLDHLFGDDGDLKETMADGGFDTTKVDVDPELFGEFPDDPDVERIPDEYGGLVSAEKEHEWRREATIVDMIGACVYCDSDVDRTETTAPNDDTIVRLKCTNDECNELWVENQDRDFASNGI